MKLLITVHYETYSGYHGAWVQSQRQFIRRRALTHNGAQRMIRNGADDQSPIPDARVTRIEVIGMQ